MKWHARRTLAYALVLLLGGGCSSTVALTEPPTGKQVAEETSEVPRARLGDLTGPACFREEVTRYLSSPGGLQLAVQPGPSDVTLSGRATRIEVHSNRGDKEVSLLYFSAFVITAPIAAVMYGAKDWHADAAADGELVASDATNTVIWKREITVSISESQRTMPSHDALKAAMTSAVCQKLAATLLNALTEYLGSRR